MAKEAIINFKMCKEAPRKVFLEKVERLVSRKEKNLNELVGIWRNVINVKNPGRYCSIGGGFLCQKLVQFNLPSRTVLKGRFRK